MRISAPSATLSPPVRRRSWLETMLGSEWGLIALVFMIYLRVPDLVFNNFGVESMTEVVTALLAAVVIGRCFLLRQAPRGWGVLAALLAVYGGVMFVSIKLAPVNVAHMKPVFQFSKCAIVAVLVVMLAQRAASLRGAVWALVAAGLVMASVSVYQVMSNAFDSNFWHFGRFTIGHIDGQLEGPRVAGPIGDPNFYAQFLVVLIPLTLDRLWARRKWPVLLIPAWALGVVGLTIVFTYSRGALVALAVVAVAMMVPAFVRKPPRLNLALTAAVLLITLAFIPDVYLARAGSLARFLPGQSAALPGPAAPAIQDRLVTEHGFRGRVSEMIVGWEMFKERPILGMGYGSYRQRYLSYAQPLGIDRRNEPREPHSLYVEIASETGIVGVAAFGAIVVLAFTRLYSAYRSFQAANMSEDAHTVAALSVALLGFFTAALFLHAAFMHSFWILLALAVASGAIARRCLAEQNAPHAYQPAQPFRIEP